jgi:hypothetical protein
MNRNVLQALMTGALLIGISQVSMAGKDADLTGTYSSFTYTQSGDIVGEEIRVLHFDVPEGYWIIYQCAEGEPSEPVFIQATAKGPRVLEFAVPERGPCADTYTATFTSKGATIKQSWFKKPLRKITE